MMEIGQTNWYWADYLILSRIFEVGQNTWDWVEWRFCGQDQISCPSIRSSPLVPNRAVLTRRNYTPVKIGIKLTGKTSGVRVWIPFIPKPARLEVICKKLAKICIFLPKKSIKISFIIKSGLQIVFLSSMGYQEHIL